MKTYDYYCTWQAQNIFCQEKGVSNRDYLDEEALFKKNGLAEAFLECRKDLYFILDDGWDVYYSQNEKEPYPFASHEIKKDRFPHFKGKPEERLKKLVDKIMSYGWKGVGIWVCAQGYQKAYTYSVKRLKAYFKKRLEWSKYARIAYWKVDWGVYGNDFSFRKMLTNLAKEIYPELIIENTLCMPPVNGMNQEEEENRKYQFPWNQQTKKYMDKVCQLSEVFRSYDVTEELSSTTTLARLCYLLKQKHSIINCEDEVYMGAILGCSLGIERNIQCTLSKITPQSSFHYRYNEAIAAMRYRTLSQPFVGTKLHLSKEIFTDEVLFGPYWSENVSNQLVKQKCPARVARNTSLPKVHPIQKVPYVVCCKDLNHHYALGTFKRLNHEKDEIYAVDVCVQMDELVSHIAIFSNHIRHLKVQFENDFKIQRINLIDMIHLTQKDITSQIQMKNHCLWIPYAMLTKEFVCNDDSTKAYLLEITYEKNS